MMFKGSIVAIVTPFKNGAVDHTAMEKLVKWHVSEGTNGIVVNGTTGEAPTLSQDEQRATIETVLKAAGGVVPVIAGVGSYSTASTIEAAKRAESLGVDGLLVVTPYYNKPVQTGLFEHFAAVAKSVKKPIILYHIPGRTGVSMTADTIIKLMKFKNIVAIKDASGDLKLIQELRIRAGNRLTILSGEDMLNLPIAIVGGCGAISVVANIVPKMMSEMFEAVFDGDFSRAAGLHLEMFDLHRDLFMETNPIPVKAALSIMKKCRPDVRLPLTRLPPDKTVKLSETLEKYGL